MTKLDLLSFISVYLKSYTMHDDAFSCINLLSNILKVLWYHAQSAMVFKTLTFKCSLWPILSQGPAMIVDPQGTKIPKKANYIRYIKKFKK